MAQPLSVSQALALAKDSLEQISATIVGEVSEFSDKPGYKAVYFTISDKSAALSCLIWRNVYLHSGTELRLGMLVEVSGVFSVYAAKGRMNFDVRALRPAGEGDLRIKVAQLAKKLEAEGLMDPLRKRPIPQYPASIAVVTSPRGKAIHDVLRTLRRRYPLAEVLVAGVLVEGPVAVQSIIEGLFVSQASNAELILLVRGGGSYEDLMPFNDEGLARAIAASSIPVVTGIGHEPDTTVADMVADFRASTPTAAAEHVVPDLDELKNALLLMEGTLVRLLRMHLERAYTDYEYLRGRPIFSDPYKLVESYEMALEGTALRLYQLLPNKLAYDKQLIAAMKARMKLLGMNILKPFELKQELHKAQITMLSPLAVLGRGFSIAYDQKGHVVDSVNKVGLQDQLIIRLIDGTLECQVREKTYECLTDSDMEEQDV